MKIKDGDVDIVHQLRVIFHRVATREENNHFLFQIFLEESVKEEEPSVGGTDYVTL
jgi:hypothetical protein